ncbi:MULTISPECIES: hypothetical protein [unclassified Streptomyces]|uniref:hypothetical protein n=1 Tax=unclassified Streptomyces TaxID=2593676 RepID=UPI0035DA06DB
MIEPEAIPLFTGDLAQLEQHTDALRDESDGIRQAGGEAHRQFQGLSAFYQAPEAEDLFASTAPARDAADVFGDKLATVADALRTYAAEVAPIAKRLERLQGQATTFVAGLKTGTGEFDENWTKDADKVDEHQALLHDVNAAQAEFAAAEIACNNKITALVGGTQYVLNTGAKQFAPLGSHLYGYSTEVLDQAKELPWGAPETERHDWWDPRDFNHYFKSFVWDGLIVDNVWGTLDGLYSMVGLNSEQEFEDSWEGLTRMVVGAETYLMEAGGQEPTGIFATDFAQGSKVYAKEFAKSLVAWDMWDENPARAAATVVFNVITLGFGPLKVASAGKAGTTAKVAATVAKVGDAIDPIGAAAKVAHHAAPRIAAVTERLRGTNHIPEVRTSTSVLEFSDATGRTVLVVEDGRFIVMRDGEVVSDAPLPERSAATQATPEQVPVRELEIVGGRAPEAAAHMGDHASPGLNRGGPSGVDGEHGSGVYGRDAVPRSRGDATSGAGASSEHSRAAPNDDQPGLTGSGGPPTSGREGAAGAPRMPIDDVAMDRYSKGTATSGSPSRPMLPDQEAGVLEELKQAKIPPQDQARVIRTLSKEPFGSEVADLISRGHLRGVMNYDEILRMCKQGSSKANDSMLPAAYMALSHATELQNRGFSHLAFELKDDVTGLDLDVTTLRSDGTPHYGYQLKDVNTIGGIKSASRKAAKQLMGGTADAKIAILDVHQPMADLGAKMLTEIEFQARRAGATFHLRFTDGSVTVPPDGPVFP